VSSSCAAARASAQILTKRTNSFRHWSKFTLCVSRGWHGTVPVKRAGTARRPDGEASPDEAPSNAGPAAASVRRKEIRA